MGRPKLYEDAVFMEMNAGLIPWTLAKANRLQAYLDATPDATPETAMDDFDFEGLTMCRYYAHRVIGIVETSLTEGGE